MEIAAVYAIAELGAGRAKASGGCSVCRRALVFVPNTYSKPFDPRLMIKIAPAVAQAAADSGVASRPIADMEAYRERLQSFVYARAPP